MTLRDKLSLILLAAFVGVVLCGLEMLAWEYRGTLLLEIELPPVVEQYWL